MLESKQSFRDEVRVVVGLESCGGIGRQQPLAEGAGALGQAFVAGWGWQQKNIAIANRFSRAATAQKHHVDAKYSRLGYPCSTTQVIPVLVLGARQQSDDELHESCCFASG